MNHVDFHLFFVSLNPETENMKPIMNQKKILLATALLCSSIAMYAQRAGGISADMLQKIERMQPSTQSSKGIFNALASNNIDNLAQNYANRIFPRLFILLRSVGKGKSYAPRSD